MPPIHTARIVKEWHEEHFDEVEHLVWPPQSLDLSSRFPHSSSLKQLEEVLVKEWGKIPLETNHNLYESTIPRRIEAILNEKGGPTPY